MRQKLPVDFGMTIIKYKNYSLRIGIVVILCMFFYLVYYVNTPYPYYVFTEPQDFDEVMQLDNSNNEYRQKIKFPDGEGDISSLMIGLGNNYGINYGIIRISLLEDGKTVYEWQQDARFIRNDDYHTFKLQSPYRIDRSLNYEFVIKGEFEGGANSIGIETRNHDITEPVRINGEEIFSHSICYRLVYTAVSFKQRVLIAGFLLFAISTFITFMVVTEDTFRRKLIHKYSVRALSICAMFFLLFFSYIFHHGDGDDITQWGYYLLNSFDVGTPRNYVGLMHEYNYVSDYSIITNIITALELAPLYIVDKIIGLKLQLSSYDNLRTLFLILSVCISAKYLKKTIISIGHDENIASILAISYMISPAVLWGNLAMGQIDCVVMMFMILSAYCLNQNKYELCFLWLSIAVSMKQFGFLFMLLPISCLLTGLLDKKRLFRCFCTFMSIPVLGWLLSHMYFINYADIASLREFQKWKHFARLFDTSVGNESCFITVLFLVCFICVYKTIRKNVSSKDFLLSCFVITASFQLFTMLNPQWIIYALPFIILLAVISERKMDSLLILAVFTVGVYLYSFFTGQGNVDNTMINHGLIGQIFQLQSNGFKFIDFAAYYLRNYYEYLGSAGKSFLSAALLAGLYVLLKSNKNLRDVNINDNAFKDSALVMIGVTITVTMNLLVLLGSSFIYFGMIYY